MVLLFLFVVVGPICAGQVASPAAENQVRTINCSAAAKSFLFRRRAWAKEKAGAMTTPACGQMRW
jgi:hypothetical protein